MNGKSPKNYKKPIQFKGLETLMMLEGALKKESDQKTTIDELKLKVHSKSLLEAAEFGNRKILAMSQNS
jgi:hypothetical protein